MVVAIRAARSWPQGDVAAGRGRAEEDAPRLGARHFSSLVSTAENILYQLKDEQARQAHCQGRSVLPAVWDDDRAGLAVVSGYSRDW